MKKTISLLSAAVLFFLFESHVSGQTPINASFETTTGTCDYNLSNSTFNTMMSNCYGFGNASQIDILTNTCGYGLAQQGNYFIGLAVDLSNTQTDALSLKLAASLTAGNTYNLNFYNRKDAGFNANILEVGYSTDSVLFGNSIGTAALPTTSWGLVSFSFSPTVNADFLTIRTIAGSYGWNFIDNFTITQTTGISNTLSEEAAVQVFPNPASDFISILTSNSTKFITATLRDLQGKTILVTDKTSIDLSGLEPGVFIVELNTDKGRIFKRVVLK
jgi:hypothetical protein